MPVFTNLLSSGGNGISSGDAGYHDGITCEKVLLRKLINTASFGYDGNVFYIRSTTDGNNIYIFRYGYGLYKFNGTTLTQMSLPVGNVGYLKGCTIIWHNGALHMIGGIERSSSSSDPTCIYDHYRYNGSSWTKISTLPVPMYYGSAVVYDGKLLIIENLHEADDNRSSDNDYYTNHKFAVYQFNDSTNTWSQFGPDIISGETEQRTIPGLYTDGKSLFVNRSYKLSFDTVITQRFKYVNNNWLYWGENEECPGNGVNNNSKYDKLFGKSIYMGYSDIKVLRESTSWDPYNPRCNYRFNNPLCVMNGEVYAIESGGRTIEKYTPANIFNLPAGATIYTNDTEYAKINGSKTLDKESTVIIANKPGTYATVMIGNTVIYMQADVTNHRVYGIKGMVVNNTKIESTGLKTIPNIEYSISVDY